MRTINACVNASLSFARRPNVSESDTPAVTSSMARKASRKGLGTMLHPVIAAVRNSFCQYLVHAMHLALTRWHTHKEHLDLTTVSTGFNCVPSMQWKDVM